MRWLGIGVLCIVVIAGIVLFVPEVRREARAILRPEPPAPITPLAMAALNPPPPPPTGVTD
jgi:hypothetical protein